MQKSKYLLCYLFTLLYVPMQAQIISKEAKNHIQERVNNGYNVSISVGILKNGKTEFFSFGHRDTTHKSKVDEYTYYEIGSVTKTFTALLLADAIGRKQMQLTDAIQKYLPDSVKVPTKEGKEITFQDLATHFSGLPRLPDNLNVFSDNPYKDYSAKLLYEFLNKHTLQNEIGDKYEYSNLGFGLLGHILSLQNKSTYDKMLHDKICTPLKLNRTTAFPEFAKGEENIAMPHIGTTSVKPWTFDVMEGAGCIRSCTKDLLQYAKVQIDLQKSDLQQAMQLTQKALKPIEDDLEIAMGWHILLRGDKKVIWHNGGTAGSSSFIGFLPKEKMAVVVLSNSSDEVDDIALSLLLEGQNFKPLKKSIKIQAEVLKDYVGVYDFGGGFEIVITQIENRLFAQASKQMKFEIFPETAYKFYYTVVDAQLEFVQTSEGKIQEMKLNQNEQSISGKKIK